MSWSFTSRSFEIVKTTPQLWDGDCRRNSFLRVARSRSRRPSVVFYDVILSPSSCRASSVQSAACSAPKSLHPSVAPDPPHDVGGQHGVAGSAAPAQAHHIQESLQSCHATNSQRLGEAGQHIEPVLGGRRAADPHRLLPRTELTTQLPPARGRYAWAQRPPGENVLWFVIHPVLSAGSKLFAFGGPHIIDKSSQSSLREYLGWRQVGQSGLRKIVCQLVLLLRIRSSVRSMLQQHH